MASWTLLQIANFLYRWSSPILSLISLIFGILILAGKNKDLKLLGLSVLFGMGNTLAVFIHTSLPYLYNAGILDEEFYRNGNSTTVATMLGLTEFAFIVVVTVLRWLYTRRAYGTRIVVLITILVLMVLGPAAQVVVNKLLINSHSEYEINITSAYARTVGIIFSMAVTAVFLVIFFKNRKTEKAIPSYWIFFLLNIAAAIISHLITIGAVNNMDNDNYSLFATVVLFLLAFITPVSNIYLFIGSRRSAD